MAETVTVDKKKLQKLVDYFFDVCSFCDEMDIYEYEEGDNDMQKMKKWVEKNFQSEIE